MKAIEIFSETDQDGVLKICYKINKSNSKVRVLILYDDKNESDDEKLWLAAVSKNPAFDFLNDPAEDIYTLKNGEPFND
ncbi:MAG: hypothetical protein WBK43_07885 [Prolixibacteraceae bacterium]|jgi:hypothetical protein|nr:hypothetical protein [Prolixibacteraceae bacterium]MDI9563179.1 hypothetical protein [Bacteroidota bacterium]NLT00413.1 hypothetical protein [Bacteroidales bacterium]OQB81172.1 MAG: hypothetical protein BWX87_00957 [Bacteroidetes bacterium ADurb.Bin123]HNU77668.1 hypothetical protein [Prolixibacteraceae bacterium]